MVDRDPMDAKQTEMILTGRIDPRRDAEPGRHPESSQLEGEIRNQLFDVCCASEPVTVYLAGRTSSA